ncbi:hypothetical protein CN326_03800 [Bacillus sp. AFS018417]|uniref:hypothetical protein n=1 Tax=Bacillus sp. AFS018417 TaxID=2033491 RepID=UPI000BF97ED7|nr:hypothetical protein [Bacillus sp. AFS018417]PEZ09177.1 hypothetical protein CN326_03800 [Bacillus sp. AFS018417]
MQKKRIVFLCLFFSILLIFYISQKGYSDKYIQWGDSVETVNTDQLERNNIPYKVKDNKVYIPEDAFNKAIMCCS